MGTMDPQLFCLRWNNHQNNLLSVFDQLLQIEAFCDVTLAVEGSTLKCHKVILAASSLYFQSIFMENTCKHPIVFLKDIRFNHIKALLDYMYHGEVSIEEEELQGLLKVAEALKVKGLVEIDEEGSTATPKVVFPYVKPGRVNSTTTNNTTAAEEREASPTPPSASASTTASSRLQQQQQQQHRIWPASPAKLLAPPVKKEDGEGEDGNVLIIDEDEEISNGSSSHNVSASDVDYLSYLSDETPPAPGMVRTIGANGKLEWKRYKQYTKDDILAAIEDVKSGMSALQASRKYGVPSRTLYDKVKKMGILTANMQKQISQKKPATGGAQQPATSMPQISLLGLQLPQASLQPAEKTEDKLNAGVMPSISGAMMISMLERLKANSSLQAENPLNLSTILSQRRDDSASASGSDSGHSSSEQETVKEEKAELDIRAQFFADLQKLKVKEMTPDTEAVTSSGINGGCTSSGTSAATPATAAASCHSVTLLPREELLPPRKRKLSQERAAEDVEEAESQVEFKKSSLEEPSQLILAQTTSF